MERKKIIFVDFCTSRFILCFDKKEKKENLFFVLCNIARAPEGISFAPALSDSQENNDWSRRTIGGWKGKEKESWGIRGGKGYNKLTCTLAAAAPDAVMVRGWDSIQLLFGENDWIVDGWGAASTGTAYALLCFSSLSYIRTLSFPFHWWIWVMDVVNLPDLRMDSVLLVLNRKEAPQGTPAQTRSRSNINAFCPIFVFLFYRLLSYSVEHIRSVYKLGEHPFL